MPPRVCKSIGRHLALLAVITTIGCATAEKQTGCSDAECYGVCLGKAWTGLNESYWKFEAFCVDGNMCNCFNSCEPERCNQYCINEKSRAGGDCDIFDCVCTGPIQDAGPEQDAGPDTSQECNDTECYETCRDAAWSDLNESYWKFEASCSDSNMCNCFNSCDPEQCNQYCVDEMSMSDGSCDFLECVCIEPTRDAGADPSE